MPEQRMRVCPLCQGAKVEARLCPWCGGVEGCRMCNGRKVFTRTCTLCKGTGIDPEEYETPERDPQEDDINKC